MWQKAACVPLLLCITSLISGTDVCHNDEPKTCFFNPLTKGGAPTFCGWSPVGHVNFSTESTDAWHVEFMLGKEAVSLTSRTACSTGGQTHCLKFFYRCDVNNGFEFSVSIRYNVSDKAELLWITSSIGNLSEAEVPITTNCNFSVIFKVKSVSEHNQNQGSVRMYDIRYANSSNVCTLQPSYASPVPAAATTSSSNMSSSLTSDRVQQTWTGTHSTTTSDGQNIPPESSDNLGIIVGVVVGVIVLICVVILLCVLLRRKRRHSSKANNTPENSDQHLDTTTSSQPSGNFNIMRSPGDPHPSTESAMPEYAVVNKPRKMKQDNPPQSPYENCDHDAQNLNQNSESDNAQEQGQGIYGISSTANNPDLRSASSSNVYQVPRGDTTTKSEDQGEEYNALDFEGQQSVSDKRHAEGKYENGAGTVYNHLNDGDEDAYNEVDRHTNAQGFSDEYSHIQ